MLELHKFLSHKNNEGTMREVDLIKAISDTSEFERQIKSVNDLALVDDYFPAQASVIIAIVRSNEKVFVRLIKTLQDLIFVTKKFPDEANALIALSLSSEKTFKMIKCLDEVLNFAKKFPDFTAQLMVGVLSDKTFKRLINNFYELCLLGKHFPEHESAINNYVLSKVEILEHLKISSNDIQLGIHVHHPTADFFVKNLPGRCDELKNQGNGAGHWILSYFLWLHKPLEYANPFITLILSDSKKRREVIRNPLDFSGLMRLFPQFATALCTKILDDLAHFEKVFTSVQDLIFVSNGSPQYSTRFATRVVSDLRAFNRLVKTNGELKAVAVEFPMYKILQSKTTEEAAGKIVRKTEYNKARIVASTIGQAMRGKSSPMLMFASSNHVLFRIIKESSVDETKTDPIELDLVIEKALNKPIMPPKI